MDCIKNLLVVNSVYSLFLYSVVFNKDLSKTIFIVSDGIPKSIRGNLDKCFYIKGGFWGYFHILYKIFFSANFREIVFCSRKYKIYGQDHLIYSFLFKKGMVLIEDGLLNYAKSNRCGLPAFFIPNKVPGSTADIHSIILTGLKPIPEVILKKVNVVNLKKCWDMLTFDRKNKVNIMFGFNLLNKKCDVLILTQPLSEYALLSENEKVEIYTAVLRMVYDKHCRDNSIVNIFLKPHPRETTSYSKLFPDISIIDSSFPSELLALNSNNVKYVYTIYSTSIYSFQHSERFLLGTGINKELVNKIGLIPSEHKMVGVQ